MINRTAHAHIAHLLRTFPAVGILGPRQAGKTTLAHQLTQALKPNRIYLDLEDDHNRALLADPADYFNNHRGRLIILDEIQRMPDIFKVLRSIIDRRRREGEESGQFLVLGSASLDLLKQSSESLAGRIAYTELGGITAEEIKQDKKLTLDRLWLRGGFPRSMLAATDALSFEWRKAFIRTYLERELPQIGPRIPASTLRKLWTMLAHHQGQQINMHELSNNLDMPQRTARRYVAVLDDLLLIRTLRPWSGNTG